jgi:membrane protein DedA with SNARE-associated domain
MGHEIFEVLRTFFHDYGYWTVAVALLLENAGVPVPGETILLFASFLAYSERELHLPIIIAVATIACTLGDNLGYLIGRRGGRPLLERYQHVFRIPPKTIARGESLFARYGAVTIFFARFVFGMRIIAGPLAGVLHMEWKRFVLFNFLGAVVWVTVISLVGYLFGSQWEMLLRVVGRVKFGVAGAALAAILFLWWRRRKKREEGVEVEIGEPK